MQILYIYSTTSAMYLTALATSYFVGFDSDFDFDYYYYETHINHVVVYISAHLKIADLQAYMSLDSIPN